MILDDFQWVMLPVETKVSLAPWTWRSPTGWMTWVCETAMSSTFMPNAFQRSIYIVKLAGGKQNTLIYLDFFLINNFWRSVWFHILPFFCSKPFHWTQKCMEKNLQTPKFQRFKINIVPWRLQDSQGGRISKRTMWRSAVRKPGDRRKGMDGKGKRMASDDNENQHSIVSIAFSYQLLQLFFFNAI